jgi:hypothetical protein
VSAGVRRPIVLQEKAIVSAGFAFATSVNGFHQNGRDWRVQVASAWITHPSSHAKIT